MAKRSFFGRTRRAGTKLEEAQEKVQQTQEKVQQAQQAQEYAEYTKQLGESMKEIFEYKEAYDAGEDISEYKDRVAIGVKPDFSKMTEQEITYWISQNPGWFEGMTEGELTAWSWENWGKYQETNERANQNTLLGIFGESPMYQIPDEVFQKLDLYGKTAQASIRDAIDTRASSMGMLREGLGKAIGTLDEARAEALGMARGDIDRIRDIQTRSREEALSQAYAARKETLAELQRGGERALDIQRLQAFGGMPGERMTREQMNANFAATQQAIKERAGGGAAALGAISEAYGGQQMTERQLAVDRAQYQAEGMAALAGGEFAQSGRMAEAMRQGRMDIADIGVTTARDLSDAYLSTSKYYTGMVGDYAGQISDAYFRGGQAQAELDVTTSRDVRAAGLTGAEMVGGALTELGGERAKQFAINQYEPYVRQREFLINELSRLDPFGTETQFYGDMIGMGQSQYLTGVQGKNLTSQGFYNAFGNTMANLTSAGMRYGGVGGGNTTGASHDYWTDVGKGGLFGSYGLGKGEII
jgi:hypothetical protein